MTPSLYVYLRSETGITAVALCVPGPEVSVSHLQQHVGTGHTSQSVVVDGVTQAVDDGLEDGGHASQYRPGNTLWLHET